MFKQSFESTIISQFMTLVKAKEIKRLAYVEKGKTYTVTISESAGTDGLRGMTFDRAFIDEQCDEVTMKEIQSRLITK